MELGFAVEMGLDMGRLGVGIGILLVGFL